MHYLSVVSTLVTFVFAAAVFRRWLARRADHLLLWAIGLLFYGLGTLTEVILGFAYNALALKVWYLTGAMLTAAWLGQGTVALLVRKAGLARALTLGLGALSVLAAGLIFAAPVTAAAYNPAVPASLQYKDILVRSGLITFLTIILNIYGTLTLVGGAIYSAWLFYRKNVLLNRVVGNILIAAGALMPAMGGTFTKAGLPDWLYVSELVGVILMYAGFTRAAGPVSETASARTGMPQPGVEPGSRT